ncbi:MAG TPA: ORF6N domain-containing protein [Methylibium sp.]|uniref:ORF6N domain-containing protein n=1 Tax=Methylibium sp. TaxID=2067992 RepID=UPI002DBE4C0D|nr:ORF6N domain-containing protein [Methylibium sp.]HEU4460642.1 ORF6N domain-containing protein [Methylibium sp.]
MESRKPEPQARATALLLPRIESRILLIRGHKVIVDADLALLFGVPTKRLNEQVKRNAERFPVDFMFTLTAEEKAEVVANCDHLVALKYARTLPNAFTEHGAIQAANVLNSPRAVEMGIHVVRAFVHLKQAVASHGELARRLAELESRTTELATSHDDFGRETRAQLKLLFDALRALTMPPDPPKRPIGFVPPEERPAPPPKKPPAPQR